MNGFVGRGRFVIVFIVIFLVAIVGLGSFFLTEFNPTITGFVAASTYTQNIDAEIDRDMGYFFATNDEKAPKEIRSL